MKKGFAIMMVVFVFAFVLVLGNAVFFRSDVSANNDSVIRYQTVEIQRGILSGALPKSIMRSHAEISGITLIRLKSVIIWIPVIVLPRDVICVFRYILRTSDKGSVQSSTFDSLLTAYHIF